MIYYIYFIHCYDLKLQYKMYCMRILEDECKTLYTGKCLPHFIFTPFTLESCQLANFKL